MMPILGAMALTMAIAIIAVLITIAIEWLSGDFDKKSLRVGRKVAVKRFNIDKNCDEFKVGKIVATRPRAEGAYWELLYAVRFDDEEIKLFREDQLFTEMGEGNDPSSSL